MTTETRAEHGLTPRLDGVVIGVLVGLNAQQQPLVIFPANPQENAIPARSTTQLDAHDIGKEIALLFEQGDPSHPLVIGRIQKPEIPHPAPLQNFPWK